MTTKRWKWMEAVVLKAAAAAEEEPPRRILLESGGHKPTAGQPYDAGCAVVFDPVQAYYVVGIGSHFQILRRREIGKNKGVNGGNKERGNCFTG